MAILKFFLGLVVAVLLAAIAFVFYLLGSVGPAHNPTTGWIAIGCVTLSVLALIGGFVWARRAPAPAHDVRER